MRERCIGAALVGWCATVAAACSSFRASELPAEPPPLASMEEPAQFHAEPDDEGRRVELPAGSFSGVVLGEGRASLEAMVDQAPGVWVGDVIENSPAHAAGIEAGDLIVAAERAGEPSSAVELEWPSQWRELELETPAGATLELSIDRAGRELVVPLTLEARIAPADRQGAPRLREEEKVGVVVRAATEVEARAAGRGPGAGAVVVGLARESAWRRAGIVYGDLILAVDGRDVADPQVLIDAIRAGDKGNELDLELVRDGATIRARAPLSERDHDVRRVTLPLIFSYEKERDERTTSILLGLVRYQSTAAAWELRLLWLLRVGGGDADRLEALDA